jgi:hypothetical protein
MNVPGGSTPDDSSFIPVAIKNYSFFSNTPKAQKNTESQPGDQSLSKLPSKVTIS